MANDLRTPTVADSFHLVVDLLKLNGFEQYSTLLRRHFTFVCSAIYDKARRQDRTRASAQPVTDSPFYTK